MPHFSLSHHPPGILCLQRQQLLLKSASLPDKMTRYVEVRVEKYGMFLIYALCKILGRALMYSFNGYTSSINCNKRAILHVQ